MEYIRAKREVRHALVIADPLPVDSVHKVWASVGQAATIGIFLLLFGTFLYIGHAFVVPVLAAAIVALTLAPLIKAAKRYGIPPWITAILVLLVALGALSLIATAIAGPVSEWIKRAPEIGATIKEKLSVLDEPLASLHQLQNSLFGNDRHAQRQRTGLQCRPPGGGVSHAGGRRASVVLCDAAVLPGRPNRVCAITPWRCSATATPSCGF